ncbi:MAG: hypothetical protein K1060chlam5_00475 [Candidatus Anoxychlamydiales bacterium]|nr:hypothetical protein [Candidatus Anoxychlamydiales bacterium]
MSVQPLGTVKFIKKDGGFTISSASYFKRDLTASKIDISAYLPKGLGNGEYTLDIYSTKFTCLKKSQATTQLITPNNIHQIKTALKTQYVFELSIPQKSCKKPNKIIDFFNFCFVEESYLAKFCDVSKLLRWGFFALTFGILLLFVFYSHVHHMNLIPPLYGIAIVGGVSSLLILTNLNNIIKSIKTKRKAKTEIQKTLCDKEIKKGIYNIIFALTLLSLLGISIPLLHSALNGVNVSHLNKIGFNGSTDLFATFNILVGGFQLIQALKNHKKAKGNKVIGEGVVDFIKGSEMQAFLQITLNVALIITGITAFLVSAKYSSFLLAAFIESTTILNIVFTIYNKLKLAKIKKDIEKHKSFKEFLKYQFKTTKEEEERTRRETLKKYKEKKDLDKWAKSHLPKEKLEIFLKFEDDQKQEFISLFYLQKIQDQKTALFKLLIGKDLTDKCIKALEEGKKEEEIKALKEEVLRAIAKRHKVENEKFIAPVLCLSAFFIFTTLSFASIPLIHSVFEHIPHYAYWILFIYGLLQFIAKSLMSPKAYVKRFRNIPTEEEELLEPLSVAEALKA